MEQTPRTSPRPDGLRPLALPRPIQVQLDHDTGLPTRLRTPPRAALPLRAERSTNAARPSPVARRPAARVSDVLDISEIWRISEEWWRDHPIQRTYYRLILEDGRPLTIFHDETPPPEGSPISPGAWYEQRY